MSPTWAVALSAVSVPPVPELTVTVYVIFSKVTVTVTSLAGMVNLLFVTVLLGLVVMLFTLQPLEGDGVTVISSPMFAVFLLSVADPLPLVVTETV